MTKGYSGPQNNKGSVCQLCDHLGYYAKTFRKGIQQFAARLDQTNNYEAMDNGGGNWIVDFGATDHMTPY